MAGSCARMLGGCGAFSGRAASPCPPPTPWTSAPQHAIAVTFAAIGAPTAIVPTVAPEAAPPIPRSFRNHVSVPASGTSALSVRSARRRSARYVAQRRAAAQVSARPPAHPHLAAERAIEIGPDVHARGRAGLLRRLQVLARAVQPRLDRDDRDPERGGDLGASQPVELHQEGRALLVGEPPHVGHQAPDGLALLGFDRRVAVGRAGHVMEVAQRNDGPADLVDAVVVRHAVQPRAQRHRAAVAAERRVGAEEHLLQRVLGVGIRVAEHLPRVGEQRRRGTGRGSSRRPRRSPSGTGRRADRRSRSGRDDETRRTCGAAARR